MSDTAYHADTGSSPLARGLPGRGGGAAPGDRIIPARAGFTAERPSRRRGWRDHPRSRGVYRPAPTNSSSASGSSPLARGLPDQPPDPPGGVRIIPARAGFTLGRMGPDHGDRDHPRSRGVYCRCGRTRPCADGSSPLARGLLQGRSAPAAGIRIIPARAGFTRPETADRRPQGDHPRSRGVYNGKPARTTWAGGSSPLARGLLGLATIADTQWRIIPARAGFTMGAWRSRPRTPDHPRSRGVYRAERIEDDEEFGSSPLARGLLLAEHPHREEDGIIPARAGFTRRRLRRRRRSRDHPRSRGVYTLTATGLGEQQGSSPLARGLPHRHRPRLPAGRIIPARAGFTHYEPDHHHCHADHPRSRGVYALRKLLKASDGGSSPLARGLLEAGWWIGPGARIIPARAGFTPAGGP